MAVALCDNTSPSSFSSSNSSYQLSQDIQTFTGSDISQATSLATYDSNKCGGQHHLSPYMRQFSAPVSRVFPQNETTSLRRLSNFDLAKADDDNVSSGRYVADVVTESTAAAAAAAEKTEDGHASSNPKRILVTADSNRISSTVQEARKTKQEKGLVSDVDTRYVIFKKKKKRPRKIRGKSSKKWKWLDVAEFGFYFSLTEQCFVGQDETAAVSALPDTQTNDVCGEMTDSTEIDSVSEAPQCRETAESPVNHSLLDKAETVCEDKEDETADAAPAISQQLRNAQVDGDEKPLDDLDDVAFFQALGINVLDNVYSDNSEDWLEWDGLCLPTQYSGLNICPQAKSNKKSAGTASSWESPAHKSGSHVDFFTPNSSLKVNKHDRMKLLELECSSSSKIYIRRDRHRRVEKAHRAVKSKNCSSIFNNPGRKRLYMHHRLFKMHNLNFDFRKSPKAGRTPPMPTNIDLGVARQVLQAERRSRRPATTQNLKYALHETNAPGHLETDLASFLISLQHRELTPEDYDMLLRLDESVQPKTVSQNVLDGLKTEVIGHTSPEEALFLCTICMEPYSLGQERKFLPCQHHFHTKCIDCWLHNSSPNCPLDGLPVTTS